MILQLNPTIPLVTPRGKGYALFMINPSDEHHVQWIVAQDDGEIWTWQNPEVRMQTNPTMGRVANQPPKEPPIALAAALNAVPAPVLV